MTLIEQLRAQAKERQAQDALCYADGGKETNAAPTDYLEWKAAEEIQMLRDLVVLGDFSALRPNDDLFKFAVAIKRQRA